jgi:glucose/arabinose dehydrogenase
VANRVKLTRIGDGLRLPVALTYAPGDPRKRLFIVEKVGVIRAFVRGADGKLRPADGAPLLEMQSRVSTATEEGLLGLAFHPDFAHNHKLYIAYTDRHKDVRYTELRAPDGVRVDPASERELLHVRHPFDNHNGGDIVFGPDGKLYLGTGDGGWANDPFGNGQNPTSLLAKMLRLDPDAPAPRPEIPMRGLRNPWRYAFDRKTGDLYIADVGQDRYEEVDVIPAGTLAARNLGWKRMEGLHCRSGESCDRSGLTLPVVEYNHRAGCSITGGFVYRGRRLPELDGSYFYADYCTALVRSFRLRDGHVVDAWDWRGVLDPQSQLANIASFGEDADGELYLVLLDGSIYVLEPR